LILSLAKSKFFKFLSFYTLTAGAPDATSDALRRLQRYATRLVRVDVPWPY